MKNKCLRLDFSARVVPIKALNEEFSLCRVYVQATGKNTNMTFMSRESIEKNLTTLSYCPIVGHINEYTDENGTKRRFMGGHDFGITKDAELRSLAIPYGVVAENSFSFENIEENGVPAEYLTADAILWTGRYPQLKEAIYSDDVWFNQSMEIIVKKSRKLPDDPKYTEITDWSYSALCLLGKADAKSTNGHTDPKENTEPAFKNARLIPFSDAGQTSEFTALLGEIKEKISLFSAKTDTKSETKVENKANTVSIDNASQKDAAESIFFEEVQGKNVLRFALSDKDISNDKALPYGGIIERYVYCSDEPYGIAD